MFIQSTKLPNQADHEKRYGDSSHLPPNFKEITAAEFAASKFFAYTPDFWEYRQINEHNAPQDAKKFEGALRLTYFYDGTGAAFASAYVDQGHEHGHHEPRYFSFAVCEHKEKRRRNVGNCLNEYTCVACGYVETIDSSG